MAEVPDEGGLPDMLRRSSAEEPRPLGGERHLDKTIQESG